MLTFDVRNTTDTEVIKIVFANATLDYGCSLIKESEGGVALVDCEDDFASCVATKQDAENLIKALQKAIKLGWFD